MTQYKKAAWIAAAVLIGLTLTYSWMQRPSRTTEAFAGDLYHGRYVEAAHLLLPPSSLAVAPDGALVLTDHSGKSTTVPKAKLPFVVAEDAASKENDFVMTALGSGTNGVLDSPAVSLYLSVDGGKVRIENVKL